ncbi:translocation/assembly module TamB domain-containing protein [Marivita sp. S6314]|uniref:translocation/assembly module TamB domain-containing protein n=1 Tax=Marivita sp. S6314 TaxID=2926406 RepID=UPI001FF4E956|nr:translocation/assembly module TamB domain-containing protein [Marivita sp. S6314]MCK0150205.1 translocation/assembly module TamB domain-containing protein [Marivita sp. S6314]
MWIPVASMAQDEDEDVGFLANLLQDSLSGDGHDVRIVGFDGALSSEATIERLTISDKDGEWFRAETIVLDWSRLSLLRGRVQVDRFSAERVVFARPPNVEAETPSAEATPFTIPDLPVSVNIGEIAVTSAFIGAPVLGEDVELTVSGSAALADGGADIQFDLKRIDGEAAQISLAAGFDPSSRDLTVDLTAEEEANGIAARLLNIPGQPALALTVQGDGQVDDFVANISLDTDGQPRITGTVEILAPQDSEAWNVEVDITGDPTPLLTEEIQPFFGAQVGLQAEIQREASGRIVLPTFDLNAAKLSVSGTAAISDTMWLESLDAKGEIADPSGDLVVLPFGGGANQVQSVTFDAAFADEITFDARVQDVRTPAATLGALTLTGRGTLDQHSFSETGKLALDLDWNAEALRLTDPGLAEAVGTDLTGGAQIDYQRGAPVRITELEANGADYGVTGTATWQSEETIPLALDLRLIAQDITRFSTLAGRDLDGRVEVTIDGAVGPISGAFDLIVDGTTLDLSVGQNVADRILSGVGAARLDARRDETGTTLRSLRVTTSATTINATGQLTSGRSALRFDGRLANLDRVFPGEAEGTAVLNGSVELEGARLVTTEVTAKLSNASGTVRLPVAGGLELEEGTVIVSATGGPNGTWVSDIKAANVQSSILSAVGLDLAGEGNLSQSESGAVTAADGQLLASGSGIRFADPGIAQALGRAPTVSASFDWQQAADRLAITALSVETGSIDVTGSALITELTTAPDVQGSASLVAQSLAPLSGLAGQSLRGQAQMDVTATYQSADAFQVSASGQGSGLGIGNDILDRLLVGVTRFEFAANGQDTALERLSATLSNPEITAEISGPLSDLNIDATLRDMALIAPDFPGALTVDGTIGQQASGYIVDVDVTGPGGADLRVDGTVVDASRANLSINGNAALGLANAFIEPRRLNGRAALDLRLNGPLAVSSLSGTITPSQAELSAPTLGIILQPITGQITLQNGAAQIALDAAGNNGGSIDVNGRVGLSSFDTSLTATFNRFGVRDVELYDTSVDGTVNVTGQIARNLLIAGTLRLGETEIQVPSSSISALNDIPNIKHLGATRPVMRTIERAGLSNTAEEEIAVGRQSTTRLDLTLSAPSRIFVRGRGLDAELGGQLRLTGTTSNIIPQGGFELVRGRLDILNQRFVLNEGRIQLSGSFDPVLRFVATTEANGIEVQVVLDGPVSSPDISFSSSPELPEDEVLAQLLFGRSLSDLSPLQALELANAVATLAGGGAGGLLTDLRDGFGLDDLDLARTDDGGTAVRAGKYITENVYSDVVVESGGRTELSINLDITRSLTARGSVDNEGNSSLGIFFERDY